MIAILYRWRVKPEKAGQFIEAWRQITLELRKNCGALGSRLHRGNDGLFYAYAQWQSLEDREKAFANAKPSSARTKMTEAIEERFPEVILEPVEDLLIFPK